MQIQFVDIQFPEVQCIAKSTEKTITEGLGMHITSAPYFFAELPQKFDINFDLTLENEAKNFRITLKAVAHFATDEAIDEAFKTSHFPRVNAPAIAYPFIRAFVSNFVLQSGYHPVILPTINFQQRAANEEEDAKKTK